MKHIHAFFLGALTLAAGILHSNGAVTITAVEAGGDVVFSSSGSINLAGLPAPGAGSAFGFVAAEAAALSVGPAASEALDFYGSVLTGPASFGPGAGGAVFASSGSGNKIAVGGQFGQFWLPAGYVSGQPISGTATFDTATFASLGMTPGAYAWTLPNADTVSLTIVPEPSRALLSVLGISAVMVRRRRA